MKKYFKYISEWGRLLFVFVTNNPQAWNDLRERNLKEEDFLSRFFYPLTGVGMLSLFLSNLFLSKITLERSLQEGLIYFLGMFVGIFSLAFLLNKVSRFFQFDFEKKDWIIFSGINMAILTLVDILYFLFSKFIFIKILQLFMIYSVFNGIKQYFKVDTSSANSKFLLLATAFIIYIVPVVVEKLLLLCI